jgi:hypothetical protein
LYSSGLAAASPGYAPGFAGFLLVGVNATFSDLTGQRRLARDVEDGVRFRRAVLPPFELEAGGVSRSNQAETMSF